MTRKAITLGITMIFLMDLEHGGENFGIFHASDCSWRKVAGQKNMVDVKLYVLSVPFCVSGSWNLEPERTSAMQLRYSNQYSCLVAGSKAICSC